MCGLTIKRTFTVLSGTLLLAALSAPLAYSDGEVKIAFLGGFTGPIESLTPNIKAGSDLAASNINDAGGVLSGKKITVPVGDTTCVDATVAANAADRLVNSENVTAIVGALCSGSTISAANNAAIPANVVMVSPASTSPAVSEIDDNDLVFRTVPSDSFQGESLAKLLKSKGMDPIAITYINNEYGKGFAKALSTGFSALGGTVAASEAHEDGKADYRAEIGSLASSGAPHLVVLAYADGSGQTIIRQAVEGGDFTSFVGGDGMVSQSLIDGIGADALEGMILTQAGSPAGTGLDKYNSLLSAAGMEDGIYTGQAYDATFLLALAVQQKGSADRAGLSAALRTVSSPPGTMIYPGEWAKAAKILASGGDVNYEGATGGHDFNENGDVSGIIEQAVIKNGAIEVVGQIM